MVLILVMDTASDSTSSENLMLEYTTKTRQFSRLINKWLSGRSGCMLAVNVMLASGSTTLLGSTWWTSNDLPSFDLAISTGLMPLR